MFNQDEDLTIQAEPFKVGEIVSSGEDTYIKIRAEHTEGDYVEDEINYNLPLEEYDQKMMAVMIEMFYARNKADLIQEGVDNPHHQALEKVKDVMGKMMKAINSSFNPQMVEDVIQRKRKVPLPEPEEQQQEDNFLG